MFIVVKFGCYTSNALHELTPQVSWLTTDTNAVQKDA